MKVVRSAVDVKLENVEARNCVAGGLKPASAVTTPALVRW